MRYFLLATDCFLVEGESDAALYDVHGGRLFLLDEAAAELLHRCDAGLPLAVGLTEDEEFFLSALQAAGLGFFDVAPAAKEKFLLRQPIEWRGICAVPPDFTSVDWQITNACNLHCAFCGDSKNFLSWQSCQSCLRRSRETAPAWMPDDVDAFLAEIARLGVRILNIRGGNPLLALDALHRIAGAAARVGLSLVITTTGADWQPQQLIALGEGGRLHANLVMFGADEAASQAACGRSGLFAEQLALIDALARAQVPFSISFLLTPATKKDREAMHLFARQRWGVEPTFCEVCTRDDVRNGYRLSHLNDGAKPLAPWESADAFFFRVKNNSCAYGSFEIGADGFLRSCSGLDDVHGDVGANGLRAALSGTGLYETWARAKADIEPCGRCVLRYACLDCSTFEFAGDRSDAVKKVYCLHDPSQEALRTCERAWRPPEFVRTLRLGDAGTASSRDSHHDCRGTAANMPAS